MQINTKSKSFTLNNGKSYFEVNTVIYTEFKNFCLLPANKNLTKKEKEIKFLKINIVKNYIGENKVGIEDKLLNNRLIMIDLMAAEDLSIEKIESLTDDYITDEEIELLSNFKIIPKSYNEISLKR
jgi:hypothetical protein